MKNKVFKKTIAAALALTLMGGGLPTAIAGTNIFEPGIIANAEGTLIATGNVYYLGDTIDFGSDDVYVKILNSVDNYADRTFKLAEEFELTDEYYTIKNADDNSDAIILSAAGIREEPIGLKVYGKGTLTNPYTFKAVFVEKTMQVSNVSVDLDDSITLKFYVPVEQFDDAGVNKVTLSGPNDAIEITSFVKDKTFYNSSGFVKIHAILSPDFIIQNGSSIVSVYDKIDESADYNYYYIQEP